MSNCHSLGAGFSQIESNLSKVLFLGQKNRVNTQDEVRKTGLVPCALEPINSKLSLQYGLGMGPWVFIAPVPRLPGEFLTLKRLNPEVSSMSPCLVHGPLAQVIYFPFAHLEASPCITTEFTTVPSLIYSR